MLSCSDGLGSISPSFKRELLESKLISRPLPADTLNFLEARLRREPLSDSISLSGDSLHISYKSFTGRRAVGSPSDPDYATYGSHSAGLSLEGLRLEGCNLLKFKVFVDSPGDLAPNMELILANGAPSHLLPLRQGWNECAFWIGDQDMSAVDSLKFRVTNRGWNLEEGVTAKYLVCGVVAGNIAREEKVSGWEVDDDRIISSTSGYVSTGVKTAIMNGRSAPETFSIFSSGGRKVFEGKAVRQSAEIGDYAVLDFSSFTGKASESYVIKAGTASSVPFRIREHPFDELQWKALNFIFCQRCGHEVETVHPLCHQDLFAVHDGHILCYGGGWHDAGDLSQQTLQSAETALGLLEASVSARKRAPKLSRRLEEEALWGLDFLEKVRFPDGSRGSSMGLLLWQDGKVGTFDDIFTVRVQGMAYDNYLYAACEAYAAEALASGEFLSRAQRDFSYAEQKFAGDGYDVFVQPYEHTFNTPHSQYQATISWAASLLFGITGEEKYAERAREAVSYLLSCQMKDGPAKGAFCRDSSMRSLVHYIHQSREQLFALALAAICKTQPGHPSFPEWKAALADYASYLKGLMPATAPYGMIPSGIYSADEAEDAGAFRELHVFLPEDAAARHRTQISCGVRLDSTHYIKRFPVWFGIYNGNNALILAQGKAAAVCASALGDPSLRDIAMEQLYWMLGKNPFAQSLVYGEGCDYPQMDSFSSGTLTGEMPVGIRTLGDSDTPYWPQVNNACYKEVWTPVAGKLFSLISEL